MSKQLFANRKLIAVLTFFIFSCFHSAIAQEDTFLLRISTLNDTLKLQKLSDKILKLKETGDWSNMYQYSKKLNDLATEYKKAKFIILANNVSGSYLQSIGQVNKACDHYFKSLRISDSINNKNGVSSSYSYLAGLYNDEKSYEKSLYYHRKALEIRKLLKNQTLVASSYNNIGIAYDNMRKFDSARYYYNAALNIRAQLKDTVSMASVFINLGEHFLLRELADSAMFFYNKAIAIYSKIPDVYSVAWTELNYSKALTQLKKYKESNRLIWKTMLFTVPNKELSMLSRSYEGLFKNYSGLRQFDSALIYYQKMTLLSDSMLDIDTKQHAIEQELAYQYELKEQVTQAQQKEKDAVAFKDKQRQKTLFYAISVVLGLTVVIALLIYKGLKQQQKNNNIISLQKQEVEKQKELVEEHRKEILDSIHYAKRIQNTLLAHHEFVDENLPNNFVLFNPKDIVSGDFYWATKHGDNFYLAVCDSTGHGVPGAFMSLLNIGFLNEAINEKDILEPNEVFNHVRKRLISSISKEGQKDGFDGILLRINQKTKEITYAAAHNAPILISSNVIIELEKDKMPVGKGERDENFTLHSIKMKAGDTLYLYTDGYADQFGGPRGKKFKYKPLNELLLSINSKSLKEQSEILQQTFNEWKGNLEQVDDVCVIGVKFPNS